MVCIFKLKYRKVYKKKPAKLMHPKPQRNKTKYKIIYTDKQTDKNR